VAPQVVDMPLLFESHAERLFSEIIVVTCSKEQQLARLRTRNGLSEAEAQARIDSQMPLADKATKGTVAIDNSGSKDAMLGQVRAVFWPA
jgi:dephospho-CoA kinase